MGKAGGDATLLSSHAEGPPAAAGDTSFAGQTRQTTQASRVNAPPAREPTAAAGRHRPDHATLTVTGVCSRLGGAPGRPERASSEHVPPAPAMDEPRARQPGRRWRSHSPTEAGATAVAARTPPSRPLRSSFRTRRDARLPRTPGDWAGLRVADAMPGHSQVSCCHGAAYDRRSSAMEVKSAADGVVSASRASHGPAVENGRRSGG